VRTHASRWPATIRFAIADVSLVDAFADVKASAPCLVLVTPPPPPPQTHTRAHTLPRHTYTHTYSARHYRKKVDRSPLSEEARGWWGRAPESAAHHIAYDMQHGTVAYDSQLVFADPCSSAGLGRCATATSGRRSKLGGSVPCYK
jgi:hypothetical protein